jgi:hypothetical protein
MALHEPGGPDLTHVVTTVYFAPGRKRPIIHAYGPMTKHRAQVTARTMKKSFAAEVNKTFFAVVNQMLSNALADPDFKGYQP